jgi:predicted RNase H-like nuclease (RuvC/YqgF family)
LNLLNLSNLDLPQGLKSNKAMAATAKAKDVRLEELTSHNARLEAEMFEVQEKLSRSKRSPLKNSFFSDSIATAELSKRDRRIEDLTRQVKAADRVRGLRL